VRIVPELRAKVRLQWLNLKDQPYDIKERMDIIFCRNVIIYFSRETQETVLTHMCSHLESGGYLFMGHSETLSGFSLPLKQVATTVYRKK
jgi:chemotaxis protein methyltransferase CheR